MHIYLPLRVKIRIPTTDNGQCPAYYNIIVLGIYTL